MIFFSKKLLSLLEFALSTNMKVYDVFPICHMWWDWFWPSLKMCVIRAVYNVLKMVMCGESCISVTACIDDEWWKLCICYWRWWSVVRAVYLLLKMMMCGRAVYLLLKMMMCGRAVYLLLKMMMCGRAVYLLLKMMICDESCVSVTEDNDVW